jgi:hypothetical protein
MVTCAVDLCPKVAVGASVVLEPFLRCFIYHDSSQVRAWIVECPSRELSPCAYESVGDDIVGGGWAHENCRKAAQFDSVGHERRSDSPPRLIIHLLLLWFEAHSLQSVEGQKVPTKTCLA